MELPKRNIGKEEISDDDFDDDIWKTQKDPVPQKRKRIVQVKILDLM